MFTLAQVATKIAADCDAAATAKAAARNLAPDTVPHLRHMLHQARAFNALTRGEGEEGGSGATLTRIRMTIFRREGERGEKRGAIQTLDRTAASRGDDERGGKSLVGSKKN